MGRFKARGTKELDSPSKTTSETLSFPLIYLFILFSFLGGFVSLQVTLTLPSATPVCLCHSDHAFAEATAIITACPVTSSPVCQQFQCISTLKTRSSHDFMLVEGIILLPILCDKICRSSCPPNQTALSPPPQKGTQMEPWVVFRCEALSPRPPLLLSPLQR